MRLIGVAMVKNEADIVEAFVRHNLGFLDRLLVIEHGSNDRTLAILEALRDEGLALDVLRDPAISFQQADRLTATLREAMPRLQADYAFALDADEFVLAPSRTVLEQALSAQPGRPVFSVPWSLYIPPAEGSDETHPLRRLRARVELPDTGMSKVVVGRAFADHGAWFLAAGNHHVHATTPTGIAEITPVALAGVRLAHLPFRSPQQFLSKIVLGWFGNRLLQGPAARQSPINWHWRELFYGYLGGATPGYAELRRYAIEWYGLKPVPSATPIDPAAVALVDDPIPHTFELRYTANDAVDPLRLLAAWTDRFLDTVRTG